MNERDPLFASFTFFRSTPTHVHTFLCTTYYNLYSTLFSFIPSLSACILLVGCRVLRKKERKKEKKKEDKEGRTTYAGANQIFTTTQAICYGASSSSIRVKPGVSKCKVK